MTEAALTRKYLDALPPIMTGVIALKHSDRFNSGYPDATVTWNGRTTWWETKFYDDRPFDCPEQQKRMCRALSVHGVCYYIIYVRVANQRHVRIVPPGLIDVWDQPHASIKIATGYDHTYVASFIKGQHEVRR